MKGLSLLLLVAVMTGCHSPHDNCDDDGCYPPWESSSTGFTPRQLLDVPAPRTVDTSGNLDTGLANEGHNCPCECETLREYVKELRDATNTVLKENRKAIKENRAAIRSIQSAVKDLKSSPRVTVQTPPKAAPAPLPKPTTGLTVVRPKVVSPPRYYPATPQYYVPQRMNASCYAGR